MKAILFGATGMVGQGVLLECLADPEVTTVLCVGRGPSGSKEPKVKDLVLPDMHDYSTVGAELEGYDACFFCLGISSAGMNEADYTRITHDLTLSAAQAIHKASPDVTFCFISGQSTDSSEKGGAMWARVKGRTENDLLKMNFKKAYMFRPGLIQATKGIKSRTPMYRYFYAVFGWLFPLVKAVLPSSITTTERVGLAMINAVRKGYEKPVLETRDINKLAGPMDKVPLQL